MSNGLETWHPPERKPTSTQASRDLAAVVGIAAILLVIALLVLIGYPSAAGLVH